MPRKARYLLADEDVAESTKLARYLSERDIGVIELSRRSGVAKQTCADAVYGRREPSLDTWAKLARGLDCTVWDISESAYSRVVGTV